MTFDDGPHLEYTEKILDILHENDIKAIFFVLSKSYDEKRLKRIKDEGHLVAHHTHDHVTMIEGKLDYLKLKNGILKAHHMVTSVLRSF